MEKGRKSTFSELTEFIAMKGQATTFGLDCLPNIKKEERVATERPLRHTNLPISHPKSTLMLTSSLYEPIQPWPTQKNLQVFSRWAFSKQMLGVYEKVGRGTLRIC